MLQEKFLPESYFDIMLYTHIEPYEDGSSDADRFKFVVTEKEGTPGRSIGIFNDVAVNGMIPNDMELVISKLREYLGQKHPA